MRTVPVFAGSSPGVIVSFKLKLNGLRLWSALVDQSMRSDALSRSSAEKVPAALFLETRMARKTVPDGPCNRAEKLEPSFHSRMLQ